MKTKVCFSNWQEYKEIKKKKRLRIRWDYNSEFIRFFIDNEKKPYYVPDDAIYIIKKQAIKDFKQELKELLEP